MSKQKGQAKSNKAKPSVNEAEVLFPEQQVSVNGETITLREFSMMEEIRLSVKAAPIIEALRKASFEKDTDISQADLEKVFAENELVFKELLATACDQSVEWVEEVGGGREGAALFFTFWSVNRSFFLDRMMTAQLNKVTGKVSQKPSPH